MLLLPSISKTSWASWAKQNSILYSWWQIPLKCLPTYSFFPYGSVVIKAPLMFFKILLSVSFNLPKWHQHLLFLLLAKNNQSSMGGWKDNLFLKSHASYDFHKTPIWLNLILGFSWIPYTKSPTPTPQKENNFPFQWVIRFGNVRF